MEERRTMAGGLFLMLGILIGAAVGIGMGQPMLGILCGTGAGIALALLVWIVDRLRHKRSG